MLSQLLIIVKKTCSVFPNIIAAHGTLWIWVWFPLACWAYISEIIYIFDLWPLYPLENVFNTWIRIHNKHKDFLESYLKIWKNMVEEVVNFKL